MGGPPHCICIFDNNVVYGSRNGFVGCAFFNNDWKLTKHEQLKGDIFENTLSCAFKENKLYTGHSGIFIYFFHFFFINLFFYFFIFYILLFFLFFYF